MPTVSSQHSRLSSIDVLRGMIMIVMALDHTRDFFHIEAVTGSPTNIDTTTPILFFTRWITHFCAPLFVFLAGLSASLGKEKRGISGQKRFLLTRGIWLIVLELVCFNLIFTFDPAFHFLGLNVLSVTGASMILLAWMMQFPLWMILVTGMILVAGHNLLDSYNAAPGVLPSLGWSLLHQQSFRLFAQNHVFAVLYPLIPWPGIILLGYATGNWFTPGYDPVKRRKNLLIAGLLAVLIFLVLRWINRYGDPAPREIRKDWIKNILSYFNTTKYPPSLQFAAMTIGPGLLLLAWLEKQK
ncbi:MAG TPA: heparan-alpha-glucosaminide N-acetyltransferase domain-containing protein, partial [Sediminibacterium sp.]|nr:heparan-alpha-glucosaminide N-acetyltransferase domain-containing protein [Sediminibacterium sp.]